MTEKSPMQLKSLHVYAYHGKSGYRVSAEFQGAQKVELALGDDLGNRIVTTCLDEIVHAIRKAADVTTESLLRGPEVAAKELTHE